MTTRAPVPPNPNPPPRPPGNQPAPGGPPPRPNATPAPAPAPPAPAPHAAPAAPRASAVAALEEGDWASNEWLLVQLVDTADPQQSPADMTERQWAATVAQRALAGLTEQLVTAGENPDAFLPLLLSAILRARPAVPPVAPGLPAPLIG